MYTEMDPSYAFLLIEQGPLILITTHGVDGDNVFPLTWSAALNFDSGDGNILISTGPWNHSYEAIEKTGRLTLNIPVASMARKAVLCGSVSFTEEPDKFKRFGLEKLKGTANKAPIIRGCGGYAECVVKKEYREDSLLILSTLTCGIDFELFRKPKIHAIGDGTFTTDGELLNLRDCMGGKIPANCEKADYVALASIPKTR